MEEEYLTTQDIANLLKVNPMTVRRWINARKLPAAFLGKEYRIAKSDLDKFIMTRKTNLRK